jgi:putative iron-regulated protein
MNDKMNTSMNFFFKSAGVALLSLFVGTACTSDTPSKALVNQKDYSTSIKSITNTVIISTYKELDTKAQNLIAKGALLTVGNTTALEAVRTAWRETRSPWEQSEGFLYGPVDTEGIDPAIDSWPLDLTFLNTVLSGNTPITVTFLAGQNNNAKGFHTIEYLLWGIDGTKKASELTTREIEYLKAATKNLQANTAKLYLGWTAGSGNFANQFLQLPSANYASQRNVLQEITDGIAVIADEVANAKIETPLNGANGQAAPDQEESRFAHNSKADFVNNIISIKNIYLGGISEAIGSDHTNLDRLIKQQIEEAIQSIDRIPGTFTQAIISNRESVKAAQAKVNTLFNTIENQLKPVVNKL